MQNFKKLSAGLMTLIMLSILTIVLGYIAFEIAFPDYPFLRKLYLSFQLFTTESGDKFYESEKSIPLFGHLIFNLARFLAIFTLIYTIVLAFLSILKDEYFLTKVKRMHRHTILCGLGNLGTAIAHNYKNKRNLVIVEKDPENESLELFKKQGAKVIIGNSLDPEILKKVGLNHARFLHALTGDDFSNLTVISHVKTILSNKNEGNPELFITANIDSRNLKVAANQEMVKIPERNKCAVWSRLKEHRALADQIKSIGSIDAATTEQKNKFAELKNELLNYDPDCHKDSTQSGIRTKLFNINELAAWHIFRQYPPDRFRPVTSKNDDPIHILLIGFSQMGEELLKLCLQNCHFISRKKTKITILGENTHLIEEKMLNKRKDIKKLFFIRYVELNPHHITPESKTGNRIQDVDVIYICSDSDRLQASYSIKAFEVFGQKIPIVRWFTKDVMSGITIEKPDNIHTVEIFKAVATHENITDLNIDKIAIATHHRWLRRAIKSYIEKVDKNLTPSGELPDLKDTMLPWHLLDEEIRDDNRSVVEHNFIKFRAMKQFTDPKYFLSPWEAEIDLGFLDDQQNVLQLAEMEHRRWMATKYYYAWRYNTKRVDPKKVHDNLIDFNKLDTDTKDYDIKQIGELRQIWELIKKIGKNGKPKSDK